MAPPVRMETLPVSDKLSPKATMGIAPALTDVIRMAAPRLTPRIGHAAFEDFHLRDVNASITSLSRMICTPRGHHKLGLPKGRARLDD